MEHRELCPVPCGGLNGKELHKKAFYVHGELIHFAMQKKLTQHYKATIL